MNRSHCGRRRSGMATLEAVMFLGSIFVVAMLLYWVAQAGLVGLFQVISSHVGSPYM